MHYLQGTQRAADATSVHKERGPAGASVGGLAGIEGAV